MFFLYYNERLLIILYIKTNAKRKIFKRKFCNNSVNYSYVLSNRDSFLFLRFLAAHSMKGKRMERAGKKDTNQRIFPLFVIL